MSKDEKYQEELFNIHSGVARSIAEAPGQEIIEEMIEAGEDPRVEAERVRRLLLNAVNECKVRRLEDLRREHERAADELKRARAGRALPPIAEMRRRLMSLLRPGPSTGRQELTFQGREFGGDIEKLSDEDVESFYASLDGLGYIDEPPAAADGEEK